MKRYYVFTWDVETQSWTPQQGVRCGPYSLFGLRKPLRKLRTMGYGARKGDPAVSVQEFGDYTMRQWKEEQRRPVE